jgi:hypothetical protein
MDNRYYCYSCPPLMQDARFLTSYTPNRAFEQYIRNINNLNSSQNYKLFLQQNATQIMNNERKYAQINNTCNVNGKCASVCVEKKSCSSCGNLPDKV